MDDWVEWNNKRKELKELKNKIETLEGEIEKLLRDNTIEKIAVNPEKWLKFHREGLPAFEVDFIEIREWMEENTKDEKMLWTVKAWAMVPKDVADKIKELKKTLDTLRTEAEEIRRWLIIHRPIE